MPVVRVVMLVTRMVGERANLRGMYAYRAGDARQFVRADVATRASGGSSARKPALIDVAAGAASRTTLVGHKRNVGRAWAAGLVRIGKRRPAVVRKRQQHRIGQFDCGSSSPSSAFRRPPFG